MTARAIQVPIDQFPQVAGLPPTTEIPLILTSVWTVTNTSGIGFDDPLALLFTNVDLLDYPFLVGPYPDIEIGLDVDPLGLLRYTAEGQEYFYAAALLGALGPGESASIPVRYVVTEPLPIIPNVAQPEGPDILLPRVLSIGVVVPEPGTVVLLASGLAGLAAIRRGRRCA